MRVAVPSTGAQKVGTRSLNMGVDHRFADRRTHLRSIQGSERE
jgi:hypothetical protein